MKKRAWGLCMMAALTWGCDGQVHVGDLAPSAEAGSSGGGTGAALPIATTYFIDVADLKSACSGDTCPCLPQTLPTDAAGQALCDVLFQLGSTDACAAHGWSQAAPDMMASVAGAQQGAQGPLCVVPQLPSADWVNGSCVGSSQPGWCYLAGADAGHCARTIGLSAFLQLPAGATAYIGCGEAPTTGTSAANSAASVGTACTPSPELSPAFAGFDFQEVTLDWNNAACSGDVCLVDHFQGLTTCPYGQDANGKPPLSASAACTVPGTRAAVHPDTVLAPGDAPVQTVNPWCTDRTASETVYCSCRCANAEGQTDDGASYCACPSGTTCSQVVPAIQSGDPRAGGYCIKSGTALDPSTVCSSECDPTAHPCP